MPRVQLRWRDALTSGRARVWIFLAFVGLVALTGGGSRSDIQSLLILRPLAVIACGYAALTLSWAELRPLRVPLALLLAFMLLHVLQMIPLPPAAWENLPKRSLIGQIDQSIGLGDIWRPLTLSPAKTANSFFALFVPLAALLLFAALPPQHRSRMYFWLAGLGIVSAVLAIFQLLGAAHGPLYLYRVTNEGYPVGLLANRNHQSMLLAVTVFILFWIAARSEALAFARRGSVWLCGILILLMVALIFVTGSRAGLVLTFLSTAAGLALVLRSPLMAGAVALGPNLRFPARWAVYLFVLVLAAVAAAIVALSRDVAFGRLVAEDNLEGMRVSLLPILGRMMRDFSLLGSGVGSFELVYKLYEPFALLGPRYLNEAHDDWAQIVIEGGLPALTILLVFIGWLAVQARRQLRPSRAMVSRTLPAFWTIAILGLASFVDYPLHVPIMAAIFTLMVAMIANDAGDPRAAVRPSETA